MNVSDKNAAAFLALFKELDDGAVEILCNGLAYIIREYPLKTDRARTLLVLLHWLQAASK